MVASQVDRAAPRDPQSRSVARGPTLLPLPLALMYYWVARLGALYRERKACSGPATCEICWKLLGYKWHARGSFEWGKGDRWVRAGFTRVLENECL